MTAASIPGEVRERIVSAATALYEQSDKDRFPTVDAVRRASRADMNAVSAVMKEWRQSQTTQAAPVTANVPELVLQLGSNAIAAVWTEAQDLANESLRTAQAGWEAERAKLDELRDELATAFESQASELEEVQAALRVALSESESLRTALAQARQDATEAQAAQALAVQQSLMDRQRADEVTKRADDLKQELARAHQDLDQERLESSQVKQAAASESERLHAMVAELDQSLQQARAGTQAALDDARAAAARIGALDSELAQARTVATEARERAAETAGRLAAITEQNAALLATLKPASAPAPAPRKPRS